MKRLVLGLIFTITLGWFASQDLNLDKIWEVFKSINVYYMVLAIIVFLVSNVLRAYRWRLLIPDSTISTYRLFIIENIGLGVNNIMPIRIVGEAVQFTLLTVAYKISPSIALASLGMTRVLDIWASTLLIIFGIATISQRTHFYNYAIAGIVISLLLVVLISMLAQRRFSIHFIGRFEALDRFIGALAIIRSRKTRLVFSLSVTVLQWSVLGFTGWIVAIGIGIDITFIESIMLVLVVIFVSTSIPSAPGAIGTFEAAVVYTIGILLDTDKNLAFTYSIVMHLVLFLPSTIIAVLWLPKEGVSSVEKFKNYIKRPMQKQRN